MVASSKRTAVEQAEWSIARLFLATRAGQIGFSTMMVLADRRRYKRPWLQFALLLGTMAESAWLARRLLRSERYRDRTSLWVDTVWSGGALVASGTGLGSSNVAPWMKNIAIGAALGAASSESITERIGALGILSCAAATSGVRARGRDTHVAGAALAANDIVSWTGMHVAVTTYIAAHRRQALMQDSASRVAVEKATEAAAANERSRQHRLVHERTLEVLKALSETEDLLEAGVLARQEAGRLRHFLRTRGSVPSGLEQALREVVEAVEADGIRIEFVSAELESNVSAEVIPAIREAVLISLLAAMEYAGASRAVLRAASEPGTVTVTVRHDAGGFEQGSGSSYEHRLCELRGMVAAVGGDAQVWSGEGKGVRFTLVAPASDHESSQAPGSKSFVDDSAEGIPYSSVRRTPESHSDRTGSEYDLDRRNIGEVVGGSHDKVGALRFVAHNDVRTSSQPLEAGSEQWPTGDDPNRRVSPHRQRMTLRRLRVLVRNAPISVRTPQSSQIEADEERTRANQTTAGLFLAWRFSGLATGVAALVAGSRRYHSSKVAALTVTAAISESIWLAWHFPRNRYRFDRRAQAVDLLTAAAVLVTGRANLRVEDRSTWINWTPWSFGANAICGRTLDPDDAFVGVVGAAALIGLSATQSTSWTDRVVNSGGMSACFAVSQMFTRQMHNAATRLKVTRAEAIEEGRRLAVEQEVARQLRLLHDSALQTLEAIGTGGYSDLHVIMRLAHDEADQLQDQLRGVVAPARSLLEEMQSLVAVHRQHGLTIVFDVWDSTEAPFATVSALCDATSEALTNVRKHARSRSVGVSVRREGKGVRVVISDDGVGFEDTAGFGFGTTHSISERMSEVGGRGEIESQVGHGTRVSLWGPT
jgi:signal transduction histidine kinase